MFRACGAWVQVENLLELRLDNADAFATDGPTALPSSILKGPMFHEMKRRAEAQAEAPAEAKPRL